MIRDESEHLAARIRSGTRDPRVGRAGHGVSVEGMQHAVVGADVDHCRTRALEIEIPAARIAARQRGQAQGPVAARRLDLDPSGEGRVRAPQPEAVRVGPRTAGLDPQLAFARDRGVEDQVDRRGRG